MTRTSKARKPGRAVADPAGATAGEKNIEQDERQPDRGDAWPAVEEDRLPPDGDGRTNQTDIERAQERNHGSIETPRQDPETSGGFLEPERPEPGRGV